MKRPVLLISLCVLFSVVVIVIMNLVSIRGLRIGGSFTRRFPPHVVGQWHIHPVDLNSYYIAYAGVRNIYLGNYTAPDHVLRVDLVSSDQESIIFDVNGKERFDPRQIETKIDSPFVYMFDHLRTRILMGDLTNKKLKLHANARISSSLIALMDIPFAAIRVYDSIQKQNILTRIDHRTGEAFQSTPNLEKQVDGIFSTDGMMHYSKNDHALFYVYFYRNQFLRMDTGLNVIYRGNTLDSISHARIEISPRLAGDVIKLSSPPAFVNKMACVDDGKLFIQSAIPADNEDTETFMSNSVVDVFATGDGRYLHSFYIPSYRDHKVSDFRIMGNKLIALYDEAMLVYDLHLIP